MVVATVHPSAKTVFAGAQSVEKLLKAVRVIAASASVSLVLPYAQSIATLRLSRKNGLLQLLTARA